jgi:hypothetical protein
MGISTSYVGFPLPPRHLNLRLAIDFAMQR